MPRGTHQAPTNPADLPRGCSNNVTHPQFEPKGFLQKLGHYPCHDPVKVTSHLPQPAL